MLKKIYNGHSRGSENIEENAKTKNSKGLIVLLVIIIIALIGFIVIDKFAITDNRVPTKEKENNDNKEEKYSMDDIIGHYTYVLEEKNEYDGNNLEYNLDLLDNGLFVYGEDNNIVDGTDIVGNYYVKDNNIVLNYLFNSGVIGGPSLLTVKGQRIINIANENELVDNNISIVNEINNVNPFFPESEKNYSKIKIKLIKNSKETGAYTSSSLMELITSEYTSLLNKGSRMP